MASDSDFIASLVSAQTYLYRIGGPVLMGVGAVSCIFSLIIFTKKNLRKSPCSIYLIAANATSFLLIYISILIVTLTTGYNTNWASYNLDVCRFSIYTGFLLDILVPFYLILASVDRVLVTSRDARIRRRSTHCLAYICIICGTLFWMLFHTHALVFTNIIEIVPSYFVCYYNSNTYIEFVNYYQLIVKAVLVPLLMIVLALWTMKNIQGVRHGRVVPVFITTGTGRGNVSHYRRPKDRQLIKMLFGNISVYIVFNLMITTVTIYQQITKHSSKSAVQIQIELLFMYVGYFSNYISFCIGCYINALVSNTFRNAIKNVLLCK